HRNAGKGDAVCRRCAHVPLPLWRLWRSGSDQSDRADSADPRSGPDPQPAPEKDPMNDQIDSADTDDWAAGLAEQDKSNKKAGIARPVALDELEEEAASGENDEETNIEAILDIPVTLS